MRNARSVVVALMLGLLSVRAGLYAADAPAGKPDEAKLIQVLKSDASLHEKSEACRMLAVVGGEASVPVLAALLPDEKMSHMARYALEPMPGDAATAALRDALGKAKGRTLAGIINSVGIRRDAQAVETIAALLKDNDPTVAQAAAVALGRIGTDPAAAALDAAMASAPANVKTSVHDGLLRLADGALKQGKREQAIAIYDKLRASDAIRGVKMAALRGAIVAREARGIPLLVEQFRGDDMNSFAVAQRVATEQAKDPEVTRALGEVLANLPADRQVLLLQVIGNRADRGALPAVVAATKSGAPEVQVAAVRALAQLGDPSVWPMLFDLALADGELARAAQASLAGIPGKEVDAGLVERAQAQDARARRLALEVLGQRRVASAMPVLLKAAEDPDAQVRASALRGLGELAGPAEIQPVVAILLKANAPQDIQAVESALSAIAARSADADAVAGNLVAPLASAQPAQKAALLRVLRTVGGAKALDAVRAAARDENEAVRDAAIRALCEWPTADAAPDLLQVAKESTNNTHKALALRGYIRMAGDRKLQPPQRIEMARNAAGLAQRDQEKRQLLGVLTNIQSPQSLNLVTEYLATPSLKDEASLAAVSIAEKMGDRNPAVVASAMKKVLASTQDADLTRRAKAVLDRVGSKTGAQ